MYNNDPDSPHDPEEDASYVEFRIEFDVKQADDGGFEGTMASVESHVHHVPDVAVVDALLVLAKMFVAKGIGDRLPLPEGVPEGVRESMMSMMAGVFLKQRVDSDDVRNASTATVSVPNDASELFEN